MSDRALSLRQRLFVLIVTPLFAVAVLLGLWRYEVAQTTAEKLFDRGLLSAALAISRDVTISEGDALSPRTRDLISDAGGGEVFYHVTGPGGVYVTGYAYPPVGGFQKLADVPEYRVADYKGEPVRLLRMTETTTIGDVTGQSVVTVWQRVADRNAFAASLAQRAMFLIAGLIVTLAIVVWFGVQLGLRPLNDLQQAIAARTPDDLSRIRRTVPKEVEGVVATLNRLFGQVDASIQSHQAFISDAAHQLRNPASALLSMAEALPSVTDPQERRLREQEVIGAARKSARLAEQLLSLERLRYDVPLRDEVLDLSDLAEQVCSDMAPLILARDLNVGFERHSDPLWVKGERVLIGEAIGNLIDNALQHGGPDLTTITVTTLMDHGTAVVRVADDGRGLTPDDAQKVFSRFGQLQPGGGSGLGLSIVEQVALLHGGEARVEEADTGAVLTVRLPVTAAFG